VTKSVKNQDIVAKVDIYNLSKETSKTIRTDDATIELWAGYSENAGLIKIGEGDIFYATTVKDKTNTITRIVCKDGLKVHNNSPLSFSYEKDIGLLQVLGKIAQDANVKLKTHGIKDTKIVGGYVGVGSIDSNLRILGETYNFDYVLLPKLLSIYARKQVMTQSVLFLSPESGLILNPENVKKTTQNLKKLQEKGLVMDDINVFNFQAFLQPQLQANDIIKVQDDEINGFFRVEKLTHTGDTRGNDWYTNIYARAV
jgi:hypothetical protein